MRLSVWGIVRVAAASVGCTAVLVAVSGAVPSDGLALDVSAGAPISSTVSSAYGWPVFPFFQQHPVRGLFGDPRISRGSNGETERTLHFGVDVVASDGTPVYATLTGWVSIHPLHGDTVMVSDEAGRVFEYWHVVPGLSTGRAIAYRTVIGRVEAPWRHVHFAERINSRYLNPLRPGAMGPYVDSTRPILERLTFERGNHDLGYVLSGSVDVVVEAWDAPPLAVPAPWDKVRLAPALVRWRLMRPGRNDQGAWSVAFDARGVLPSTPYSAVFTTDTRQNRTYRTGRYRFYLARRWNTPALADGPYALQVSVADIRGHVATDEIFFATANL